VLVRSNLIQTLLTLTLVAAAGPSVGEDALPSGDTIVANVNARDDGAQVHLKATITLRDKGGSERVRESESWRKYYGTDKKTLFFFTSPANIRDTGFLTFDYADPARDDDQWLYLPAARKVRRISASDRGDFFVGTDFTFEDIKKESKISQEDFTFKTLGEESIDGHACYRVEATPVDEATAKELGYSRAVSWFDREIWLSRKSEYFGANDNLQRTILSQDIEQVDGIWIARRVNATNLKTGHASTFQFTSVDYASPVDDVLFTERALARGVRGN
jgi:hypothetical protein